MLSVLVCLCCYVIQTTLADRNHPIKFMQIPFHFHHQLSKALMHFAFILSYLSLLSFVNPIIRHQNHGSPDIPLMKIYIFGTWLSDCPVAFKPFKKAFPYSSNYDFISIPYVFNVCFWHIFRSAFHSMSSIIQTFCVCK